MQIQLKQNEIVAALKQYISTQGISLRGKNVDISFTAGRKESGITADISIEDIMVYPLGAEAVVTVPADTTADAAAPEADVAVTGAAAPAEEPPFEANATAEAQPAPAEKKTTSLFN